MQNKSVEFWQLPKILIIVLKRFTNLNEKINKDVLFPFNLDMSKYSRIKEGSTYELYAVGNHIGCAFEGGHYNAYCKNSNNLWYVFDDDTVRKINRRSVISSSAYCLFYSKNN